MKYNKNGKGGAKNSMKGMKDMKAKTCGGMTPMPGIKYTGDSKGRAKSSTKFK